MKKLILLFAYIIPFLLNGQAVVLDGPTTSCAGNQDAWTMTVETDCVCSIEVLAIGGVECQSGESTVIVDPPFPPSGPPGCEEQIPQGFDLPFEMCWESMDAVLCVTPIFCDGSRGRRSCRLITEDEDCDKDECNDGILNGDEFTVDCGPSCECDCDVKTLNINAEYPHEVCTGSTFFGLTCTSGLYDYEWSISPGAPQAYIYNYGGNYASIQLNSTYSYQSFYVTVTAKDCNGNTLTATAWILTTPCNGWGFPGNDDPIESTDAIGGYGFSDIKLMPNPSRKYQEIKVTGLNRNYEEIAFEIVDISGKVVQGGFINPSYGRINLNEKLTTGMYLVRFNAPDNTTQVKKLMIRD